MRNNNNNKLNKIKIKCLSFLFNFTTYRQVLVNSIQEGSCKKKLRKKSLSNIQKRDFIFSLFLRVKRKRI